MREEQTTPADDELARWIRSHPEVWHLADATAPQFDREWIDHTVDDIVSGARAHRRSVRRRHRRRIVAVGASIALLTAGGTTITALLRAGQPPTSEAGSVCVAEAPISNSPVASVPGAGPSEGCDAAHEQASPRDSPDGTAPDLVACVDSTGGRTNVFPGDHRTCRELGLTPSGMDLVDRGRAIIELQERLAYEINLADCPLASEAAKQAELILVELGMTGWSVQIDADAAPGSCALAGFDKADRTVLVSTPDGDASD